MKPTICPIGNGATLTAVRTDRFKNELFTVQYVLPVTAETTQKYTLLAEVLPRGTEQYPTKALFHRRLDDLYASTIAPFRHRTGDAQIWGLAADFLGARFVGGGEGILPQIVEMTAECLGRPYLPNGVFHEPYVESEKRHIRDVIRARINDPRTLARARCRALLCPGEPYALSLSGEEETIEELNAENLTAQWRELIATAVPNFFYVGNTPPEQVAERIKAAFSIPDGRFERYPTIVRRQIGDPARKCEEMPFCQGQLTIGYRTDITVSHPLAAAMTVFNEIFGASPVSKLFLNVREKRGLCYRCGSLLDLYKGVMFVGAGMKAENREVTEAAIRAEFEAMTRGEIDDAELNAAKRSLDNSYRQIYDSPVALAAFTLHHAAAGSRESVEERRAAVAAVTRDNVAEAAARVREGAVYFLKGTLAGGEVDE